MGKYAKKGKKTKKFYGDRVKKPGALVDQILGQPKKSKVKRVREEKDDEFVNTSLSKKILKQSEIQRIEDRQDGLGLSESSKAIRKKNSLNLNTAKIQTVMPNSDDESNQDIKIPENIDKEIQLFQKSLDISREDAQILEEFAKFKDGDDASMKQSEFITQFQETLTEIQTQASAPEGHFEELDPEAIIILQQCGEVLSKYRSGMLPKILKRLPLQRIWQKMLFHTKPEKWTAAAMFQMTRIFVSNLHHSSVQSFLKHILLPRVRDDIATYKRVNVHIYQSLCKALYKPPAFHKGILLPLCHNSCTLREAVIIGSVIEKMKMSSHHAAAAIKHLVTKIPFIEGKYAHYIFLRVYLNKKYALVYSIIDECVNHFEKFIEYEKDIPVLIHQALLTFVERYKQDLTVVQKQTIMELINVHSHHQISPEIRRELISCEETRPTKMDED